MGCICTPVVMKSSPHALISLGCRPLILVAVLASPFPSQAGSFYLEEQSVRDSGRASAGQSAVSEDAASVFHNPASAAELDSTQITVGGYAALVRADLDDTGSEIVTPGTLASTAGGAATRGGDGGNPFGSQPLLSMASGFPLGDERTSLALSATVPFGIQSDYGSTWFGRYDSTRTDLTVAEASATLGRRVNDRLSAGVSLVLRYARAELERALPDPLEPAGSSPATDGRFSVEGDEWVIGYAAGLRYDPLPGTTVGVAYRSGSDLEMKGHTRLSGLRGPLAVENGRVGSSIELRIPDLLMLGIRQEITPRLTLLGQATRFDWGDFEDVEVELEGGRRIVNPQGYHDSWAVSLGAEYVWSERLTLRTGAQVDRTPVDSARRSARTPDADRLRVSLGFTYRLRDDVDLDFAYTHVFVEDSRIDRTDTVFEGTPVASTIHTRARAEASADVIGVALRYRF